MNTSIGRDLDEIARRLRDQEGDESGHTDQLWVEYRDQVSALNPLRYYNRSGRDRLLREVHLSVDGVPTGQAIIIDMNIDGVSAFAPANRPQIADSANTGYSTTFANDNWANGSYLTFDLDQSGVGGGTDMVILVTWN